MDASVEINYPVDVTGSDGFPGDDRVTVTDVKDFNISVSSLEATSLDIFPDAQLCRDCSVPSSSSVSGVNVSKQQLHCSSRNGSLCVARTEQGQVQRRAGKVSRSSGYSKRPRIALLEDAENVEGVDDSKDLSNKNGLLPMNCEAHDKAQLTKQKNLSSRRGDRRNFKVPLKTKYDSFSVKTGLAGFSSGIGGNNIFGLYGLKTDVHDITGLIDDLPLNDLLDGAQKCASSGKEKGRKLTNVNENIMHSIRKACSILQPPRSSQSQSFMEIDTCSREKMSLYNSSSVSVALNGENGASPSADISSSNKESCSKPEAHDNLLDFPLCRPKETLDHLALPVPKDLESLLMEVGKPGPSSRNAPDLRPAKQMSRRAALPPFHWSHFGGHHRTNSDVVKLLNSRATCQGRWVRIRNIASSPGLASNSFSDLETLTYDTSLVPLCGPKSTIFENNVSSICAHWSGCGSLLTAASATPTSQTQIGCGGDVKHKGKVEHCPGILAAAQTLCDMAIHTSKLNEDGMMRWPKKPSQKAMKARKSKSNENPEDSLAASTSLIGSLTVLRNGADLIMPSKRPKHSAPENKKNLDYINGVKKGPMSASSLSNKLAKDAIAETRHSAAYVAKQPCMMPPPDKVLNRTCDGQQKVHKLMQMDWKRYSDRQK